MNATSNAPIRLMAHLVAGYPTEEIAFAAAQGLAEGQSSYFEVQFPFSDPSADGKAIQTACSESLSHGFTVNKGFSFVARLRSAFPEIPVFIMTYANLAWKAGIDRFIAQLAEAGAAGCIIPDLPFDSDEGLAKVCRVKNVSSVPVAAPSMTEKRISALLDQAPPMIYAALRAGITGSETRIDAATLSFLASLSSTGIPILGGFGIRNGEQSRALAPHVHAVVAGSAFVDLIRENETQGPSAVRPAVRKKALELAGVS